MKDFIDSTYENTQNGFKSDKSHDLARRVYRGVSISSTRYKSRPLESWTQDEESAKEFAGTHLLIGSVHPKDVLWHHEYGFDENHFIPHEIELVGKKEHVVFGHRVTLLTMIPKEKF